MRGIKKTISVVLLYRDGSRYPDVYPFRKSQAPKMLHFTTPIMQPDAFH